MSDGTTPTPGGGWAQFVLTVDDLESYVTELREQGVELRNELLETKDASRSSTSIPPATSSNSSNPQRDRKTRGPVAPRGARSNSASHGDALHASSLGGAEIQAARSQPWRRITCVESFGEAETQAARFHQAAVEVRGIEPRSVNVSTPASPSAADSKLSERLDSIGKRPVALSRVGLNPRSGNPGGSILRSDARHRGCRNPPGRRVS